MAGTLTGSARPPARRWRGLVVATLLVVALHALALLALARLLQPPSVLRDVAPPFYTRSIAPQAPAPVVAAPSPNPRPNRPIARLGIAPSAAKKGVNPGARKPLPVASAPAETEAPDMAPAADAVAEAAAPAASVPDPAAHPTPLTAAASAPPRIGAGETQTAAAPQPPASAASDAPPAFLDGWPADTRVRYKLGGNYRGEVHGNAQVLWQREGTRYQAVVEMDVGLLMSSRFTSQGAITEGGLRPEVYEELLRGKRRGVRLEPEAVRLQNGQQVPRPEDVQDAASQFVELGHRFATGKVKLQPGGQINFWLARPGGVDEWTYDVVGEDILQLPRLGAVPAVHLKPRPLARPRGPIMAEIWFAPSLQYLPVRVRITQDADTYIDLLVESIEQR